MSEAWIPVLFTAIIVIGVVGGSLAMMAMKELLPILRTIAEQRQAAAPGELQRLTAQVRSLEDRLTGLEEGHRRLAEEAEFAQKLLAGRPPAE